jgi:hypothetical protein
MINQGTFDIHTVNLAFGKSQALETSDFRVEFMIVCILEGVLDVFFGANTLSSLHLRFRAGEPVCWLPIAMAGDKFNMTLLGNDVQQGTTIGTLIFVSGQKGHFNG